MLRLAPLALLAITTSVHGWVAASSSTRSPVSSLSATTTWFAESKNVETTTTTAPSLEKQKAALLQLGAALDRGQSYNPTSGEYVSFPTTTTTKPNFVLSSKGGYSCNVWGHVCVIFRINNVTPDDLGRATISTNSFPSPQRRISHSSSLCVWFAFANLLNYYLLVC